MGATMKKPSTKPDPTPQSPIAVEKNPAYELMDDYVSATYWPSAAEVVVRHKESNTFWQAVYAVREDDSDAEFSATWTQVAPKQVVITKYEPLRKERKK